MTATVSPDSRYVALGALVAEVTIVDRSSRDSSLERLCQRRQLQTIGNRLRKLTYNLDGSRLVGITDDGYLNYWNLADGERHSHWQIDRLQVTTIIPHPSELQRIIIGMEDGSISIWDLDSQTRVDRVNQPPANRPREHHQAVSTICAMGGDRNRLISCNVEGTIEIWEWTPNGLQSIYKLMHPRPYRGMKLAGATGLNSSQRSTLLQLGASVHS